MDKWEEGGFVPKSQQELFGLLSIDLALFNEGHACSKLVTKLVMSEIFSLVLLEDALVMLKQLFSVRT